MGIKGRRVHMIEELSETVISFQRVNPGAKERLVQITGPEEDKITFAKQLIEETIKRNASPIREVEKEIGSNSSLNSCLSEDINAGPNDDYTFSICQADKRVMVLKGQDLELLKQAKIILELYLPKKGGFTSLPRSSAHSSDDMEPDFVNAASSTFVNENPVNAAAKEAIHVNSTHDDTPISPELNSPVDSSAKGVKDNETVPNQEPKEIIHAKENISKNTDSPFNLEPKETFPNNGYLPKTFNKNYAGNFNFPKSVPKPIIGDFPVIKPFAQRRSNPYSESPSKETNEPVKELSQRHEEKEVTKFKVNPKLKSKAPSIEYTKHFLMDCSSSKASLRYPADWDKISSQFPFLAKESPVYFDAAAHAQIFEEYVERKRLSVETEN